MGGIMNLLNNSVFRQYAVVIIIDLNLISTGMGLAWSSPVLLKLMDQKNPVLSRPITEQEGSLVASMSMLGCLFCNLIFKLVVDHIGRKYTILLASLPRTAGYLCLLFASEVWMLLLGRFLIGISDCLFFGVVPMYTAEISSKKIRGSLGTVLQFFSIMGIVIMLGFGPFLDYIFLNSVTLAISVITPAAMLFLPESPYFLYSIGKKDQALNVLKFFQPSESAALEEFIEYELMTVREKVDMKNLLTSRSVLKSLTFTVILTIGAGMSGHSVVQSYLQTILESTQTNIPSNKASMIIAIIQLISCLVTSFVIDKYGRKPVLTMTLVGMFIGLFTLGGFYKMKECGMEITGLLNILPIASLIIILCFYSAGLGSVLWVYITEIFDGPARSLGVYTGLLILNIIGFFLNLFMSTLLATVGASSLYLIFGACCMVLCCCIWFLMPETLGRSIEEIQISIGKKRQPCKVDPW